MAFDADAIVTRIRQEAARRLLMAALALQSAARKDVSQGNPAPHDHPAASGDYPKLRTGQGRASIAIEPATVAGVMQAEAVAVGYREPHHLYWLGQRGWKWVADTYTRERARIRAIIGSGAP